MSHYTIASRAARLCAWTCATILLPAADAGAQDTRGGYINLYGGSAASGMPTPVIQGLLPPELGQEMMIGVSAPGYEAAFLWLAAQSDPGISFPFAGTTMWLYLPPVAFLDISMAFSNGQGSATIFVPPVPSLVGADLAFQSVAWSSFGGLGLSSLLLASIGDGTGNGIASFDANFPGRAYGSEEVKNRFLQSFRGRVWRLCNDSPQRRGRIYRVRLKINLWDPRCINAADLQIVLADGPAESPTGVRQILTTIPFPPPGGEITTPPFCVPWREYIYIYNPNVSPSSSQDECGVGIEILSYEDLGPC